jgi:hypothetical protein
MNDPMSYEKQSVEVKSGSAENTTDSGRTGMGFGKITLFPMDKKDWRYLCAPVRWPPAGRPEG